MAFSNIWKVNFAQSQRSHAINLWFSFQYLLELSLWLFCLLLNRWLCQHLKALLWTHVWCCFCLSIHFIDWWIVVHSTALKSYQLKLLLFWRFNRMFRYTSILDRLWCCSFLLIKLFLKRLNLIVLFRCHSCTLA